MHFENDNMVNKLFKLILAGNAQWSEIDKQIGSSKLSHEEYIQLLMRLSKSFEESHRY